MSFWNQRPIVRVRYHRVPLAVDGRDVVAGEMLRFVFVYNGPLEVIDEMTGKRYVTDGEDVVIQREYRVVAS